MKLRREHKLVIATTVLAVGAPIVAASWIHARTENLAGHLSRASETPSQIGKIDADLTGTIRLSDVSIGNLIAAESIEASVAHQSLLDGDHKADEIRVAAPHIAIQVDRDGDSDLARLVRRFAGRRPSGHAGHSRVRRIVVSSGTLVAHIEGIGELAAESVELVPDAGGVRVITGPLRMHGGTDLAHGEITLARSAAELSLPHVRFARVLGVAGSGRIQIGDRVIAVRDVAVGRLSAGGSLEAHGLLDDGGVQRSVAAELSYRDGFALAVSGDRVPLAPFAPFVPHGITLTNARGTGKLVVRRARDTIQLAIDAAISGLRLDHKALAPEAVPVDGTLVGSVTIAPQAIAVDHAQLTFGAAKWSAKGWLRRGSPLSGQVDLQLAPAKCMDLIRSLPLGIRGPLDGIAMTGNFGGRARASIDLAAPLGQGVTLATDFDNGCNVIGEPAAADVTTLAIKEADMTDAWVFLHRLPSYVPNAFISAEDGKFWVHHGFDVEQIARSFEIDLRERRLSRGGSTISQQLIKNTFLTLRRSFDRKVQEAILTWRLESQLDKKTILERYLNIIELGPHINGIRQAADYWFDRSPRELDIKQAAFLAALTSEPTSMGRRIRKAGGLDPQSADRVDIILRAMFRDGVIDRDELAAARDKPMRFAAAALRREI
jgi:hypothetical protein